MVYESSKENQHEKIAYRLDNLENGKNYQIGIFPCTKDDVICLSPIQLIGQPRYIRPKQIINYDYLLKHLFNDKDNISNKDDIEIDKDIYMTDGKINIGKFVWNENRFSTSENTTLWFEPLYPLLEGGKLTFTIYNNNPCTIQVYVNQLNIFNIALNRRHVYYSSNDLSFKHDLLFKKNLQLSKINDKYEDNLQLSKVNDKYEDNLQLSKINNKYEDNSEDNKINIKIPAQYYSKIIIDVQSEYVDTIIDIKDIELNYNNGEK